MRFNIQTKLFLSYLLILLLVLFIVGTVTLAGATRMVKFLRPVLEQSVLVTDQEQGVTVIKIRRDADFDQFKSIQPVDLIESMQEDLIGVLVAVTGIAILFSYLFSRMFVGPVQKLKQATVEISKGNYDYRVGEKSTDEIGDLSRALNTMADRLQEIESMRRDLVSNVSHELATPLTSIQGYTEALRDGVISDEDHKKRTLVLMADEIARLNAIIDDLRELSKIESSRFSLSTEPLSLMDVIQHTIESMKPLSDDKNITVETDLAEKLPNVLADRSRLSQILVNLLDNAIRYTPEGGLIKISTRQLDNFVAVDIGDTGKGIPDADLPYIFDRFYRGDKSRSRETGGTGIGLAIVKQLVHAHGGGIAVNTVEGQGTTFTFTLPKAPTSTAKF